MSSLNFAIFCGKCFRALAQNSKEGGSVLSCGDFLCAACAATLIAGSSCPACGKQGVRAVFLNDSLPDEVKSNITDPTKELESIHGVLSFQIRYYKQMIKKLLSRLQIMDEELQKKNRLVRELESKLTQRPAVQPFFTNTAQNDFENGGIVDRNVGNNSSRQPITNTGFRDYDYNVNNSVPSTPEYFLNRQTSTGTTDQRTDAMLSKGKHIFQQQLPSSNASDVDIREKSTPQHRNSWSSSRTNYKKNSFLPSRNLFSAQSNNSAMTDQGPITPTKIRSPHLPIVHSPSNPFNPYKGKSVQQSMRPTGLHESSSGNKQARSAQSPIRAFVNHF